MREKPTHVYIGRDKGGCCLAVVTDDGDKHTAESVAGFIKKGLAINRIDWQTYVEQVSQEPTFMNCQCKPEPEPQPKLFEVGE